MNTIQNKFPWLVEFILKISRDHLFRQNCGDTDQNLIRRLLKNPFIVYILSFSTILVIYQFGWSESYPVLSWSLLIFFGLTFCASISLAMILMPNALEIRRYEPGRLPTFTVLLLISGFSADLVYTGVPLLSILQGHLFDGNIGVPTLHVFNVTFGSAFATIRFTDYLYSKRLRYLAEAFIPIIFFLLILYRGPIIMCLVSWCFVYFIKNGLNIKRGAILTAITLIVLYLFGSIGDIREHQSTSKNQSAAEILGKPTEAFRQSGIPRTYFWAYIYLTSPMANLQLTTNTINIKDRGLLELFVSEIIPDFISKHILPIMGIKRIKPQEVSAGLNVATIYGRAYAIAGWLGCVILFASLSMLILVYLALIKRSPYGIPCLALLNMLVVFCTFQNMIAFTGVILQLAWPLVCPARRNKSDFI